MSERLVPTAQSLSPWSSADSLGPVYFRTAKGEQLFLESPGFQQQILNIGQFGDRGDGVGRGGHTRTNDQTLERTG